MAKNKLVNLLPEYLKTDKNNKFLSSTLDQLTQEPELERIDGYIGSKLTLTYNSKIDNYIPDNLKLRKDYQLEPALVIKNQDNIDDAIAIDDLINEIKNQGGRVDNLDKIVKSKFYSFDPNIDYDKFVNFQDYYWLTTGPQLIEISGRIKNTTSTYTVVDNELETSFIISPDGLSEDPTITLYRNNTYHFDITSKHKFFIKTVSTTDDVGIFNQGIFNNGTSTGIITFVVNEQTPNNLYYISDSQESAGGQIVVKSPRQNTFIDVEKEIIGKKTFTSSSNIEFSNGMKIKFVGEVYPEFYREKEFFVEGVGSSIQLIEYSSLVANENISNVYNENFDATPFDSFPFDKFKNLPIEPEYFTINRSSRDLNPWSRYNRWFHSSVIKISAEANNNLPVFPLDKRAKRPIIEFVPNIQLYNFGTVAIQNVDLIDDQTTDAFSTVEGSQGFYIDGVPLEQGNRVIFNADKDSLVKGRIYRVNFVLINGYRRIDLIPASDHIPFVKASISVLNGNRYKGTSWWFNGDGWKYSQQHTTLNQAPLFDVFDSSGKSYSEDYDSDFKGSKIFAYEIGTGKKDPVLGLPLKYKNSVGTGSFSFKVHYNTDNLVIPSTVNNITIPLYKTFIKISNIDKAKFATIWKEAKPYRLPIIQQGTVDTSTDQIKITVVDTANINDIEHISVFTIIDSVQRKLKSNEYSLIAENEYLYVKFVNALQENTNVYFKIYTALNSNANGSYEIPLSITNNPTNTLLESLTLSEITDHLQTMTERSPEFKGNIYSDNNLRDLPFISQYGTRLITNINPLSFANFFIGKKENNLIDAITKVADDYNQFKINFLNRISQVSQQENILDILENALFEINKNKNEKSPYYYSDMVPYGTDKKVSQYVVRDENNLIFSLREIYDPNVLSLKACLVYVNDQQLILNQDYIFDSVDPYVEIKKSLRKNDVVVIVEYFNTSGSFVPPTPSKLGLYPVFEPKIFLDNTYANGEVLVIQGHDGSITKAYNDFRDLVILEYERRIFNNIKSKFNFELINTFDLLPGAFRKTPFSLDEVNQVMQRDFIKWAGIYGIDYINNNTFDSSNPFTWNFKNTYNQNLNLNLAGSWRAIYYYFYDTDRPHTHPWEMLGFSIKPDWWDDEYGPAPYTSQNEILWNDIKQGLIKRGERKGVNINLSRPKLEFVLPVDGNGNLVSPDLLTKNYTDFNKRQNWIFGDMGPAETAWRRSSYYPFAIQRLLSLLSPDSYSSLMYDPSRLKKNIANQFTYQDEFIKFENLIVFGDDVLTDGYSQFIAEVGKQRTSLYRNELIEQLKNIDFNLFYKVGGFVNKNKLQIIIDSYDPVTTSPGAILPQENYQLILNVSNPVKSISVSGIIVQKNNGKFVVKGYDNFDPYFTVFEPIRTVTTPAITIGGVSESYVNWEPSLSSSTSGLTSIDTTTATPAATGKFYQQGQIVSYNNRFYRVKISHKSELQFNNDYFTEMPSLPIKGGATVQTASRFSKISKKIPYGTEYNKIQEVYDLIIGYGKWLESEGFVFEDFNIDINTVIDWEFTGKEFLYWTTQNWADNSIITLSPFANQLKYKFVNSVVDNVFNNLYAYSFLRSNGSILPPENLNITRDNGIATIETINTSDGVYFARLNLVQKEHAMVFNNETIFSDTIYNKETGYRQRRMKISGFRTKNWDGDYFSPGFIFDEAKFKEWKEHVDYLSGEIVKFGGYYYSALTNVKGTNRFNFDQWKLLAEKPVADLIPNFDYKISQFEDFYSLDIDNFDDAQQKMAQHLIGYTPRPYLNNIFTDKIAQYKFYQGFIKEKGTKSAFDKLEKATINNLQGKISFSEEWAFRIGNFGAFNTYKEIEFPLLENKFIENPQILNFDAFTSTNLINVIYNITPTDLVIKPENYSSSSTFITYKNSSDDFILQTAGYVRSDDVQFTAFNESDLISLISSNNLRENDNVWLGFKNDGSWDVLRYSLGLTDIIFAGLKTIGSELLFETENYHNLKINDIVLIEEVNDQVNGVYKIKSIPKLTQFIVSTTITDLAEFEITSKGLIFKLSSHRFENFDSLPSDNQMLKLKYGTKFWVDNDNNNKWVVYEKVQNYSKNYIIPENIVDQRFGWDIYKDKDLLLISSPNYYNSASKNYGKINVIAGIYKFTYSLNDDKKYCPDDTKTQFGNQIFYDNINYNNSGYGLLFAGAPEVSHVKEALTIGNIRYAVGTGATSTRVQEGALKISAIDPSFIIEKPLIVLLSPDPISYENFGFSFFIQTNTTTNKLLLVSAPGSVTTGTVYSYNVSISGATLNIVDNTPLRILPTTTLNVGSKWGYSIAGSSDASYIAISAPNYSNNSGYVEIFNNGTSVQKIIGDKESNLGEKVVMTPNGKYLFISSPNFINDSSAYGKVDVYQKINQSNTFTLVQHIFNPVKNSNKLFFGKDITVDNFAENIVISSLGEDNNVPLTFDKHSTSLSTDQELFLVNEFNIDQNVVGYLNDRESAEIVSTTFDSGSTLFFDTVEQSGLIYTFHRTKDRFVLVDELRPKYVSSNTNFGTSVDMHEGTIYVGAPCYSKTSQKSTYHEFVKKDESIDGFKVLRHQPDLVDSSTVNKVFLLDTFKEEIVDYLEVIDPLKGRISGLAEQELTFKLPYDPAIYFFSDKNLNIDVNSNWKEEHVGELWWDLSSAKYIWYEQGDLLYRKNNWGNLFPGCSIDIYEWVETEYLPSEWASLADTSSGLSMGVSGTPRYDDSSISIKEVYDNVSGSFKTLYYYWVKNKNTLPNVKNRRITAAQVTNFITDPTKNGIKFISLLSPEACAVSNVGDMLKNNVVNLNIAYSTNNKNLRHTEWLLIDEGSSYSFDNFLLEKKLYDSLLGRDKLGNLVPDITLSERLKYGISVRPRQSMFKNRFEALRNLFEFVNGILIQNQISGNYNFTNLEKQDNVPSFSSNEYDQLVEDDYGLELIDTRKFTPDNTANITCTLENGRVASVSIIHPGFGYKTPPNIKVIGTFEEEPIFKTEIDNTGRIVDVKIISRGKGITDQIKLKVRPYTVIVLSDQLSNNKWTKFEFNPETKSWIRANTQKYNTKLYWNYVDWQSESFNKFKDYKYTIDALYQVEALTDVGSNDYIKINNSGNGSFIILEKTPDNVIGNFNTNYNIVYIEKGTIQISSTIWSSKTNLNFDQDSNFDQTLYDQTPDIELENILNALKYDIFVGELKKYWNLFFFKAVRYAMTEQKLLDWAFKTSFINITNEAGGLDKRPVYKLQNSEFYEDYVNEVKPYHTKIRKFTTRYNEVDSSNSFITDFDLPAKYNNETKIYESISLGNPNLQSLPWKSWNDNYKYSVKNIIVGNPGAGYLVPPNVLILTAPGDTGSGARAKAYISSGSVSFIEVLDPGTGYVKPPLIIIEDNGSQAIIKATAYAQLSNETIRKNKIGFKFDRIATKNKFGNRYATDTFVCDGISKEFVLNWLAEKDKNKITITLDKSIVLSSDYTIVYFTEKVNEYSKKYSKIVFLNQVPSSNQVLEITYPKSIELFNAAERILEEYKPTDTMPGVNLPQLMYGVEYPQTSIETVPFYYNSTWNADYSKFGEFPWAEGTDNFVVKTVVGLANEGTKIITLSSIEGISQGQQLNVISQLTATFSTSTVYLTSINTSLSQITVSDFLTRNLTTGDKIEFWSEDSYQGILDSSIQGGSWDGTLGQFVGALGINPEDITIDGDKFINPNTSHAPEEFVPGHVIDSLSINVYTKNPFGAPVVISGSFPVFPLSGAEETLPIVPPNINCISVVLNQQVLTYVPDEAFSTGTQFSVRWETNELVIPEQSKGGMVGYTILSIGGGRENTEAGLIDTNAITFTSSSTVNSAQITSLSSYNSIKSAYVTIDGSPVPLTTTSTSYGYMLTYANEGNKRAAVDVYKIPEGLHTLRAWFFTNPYKYFNEVNKQVAVTTATTQTNFVLLYPPGNSSPAVANMIVEYVSNATPTDIRRLLPPTITYYEINSSLNYTFLIDKHFSRPPNTFSFANVNAYLNGKILRPGFDYTISSLNNTITFQAGLLKVKDTVAIVGLVPGDYDFNVVNNTLILSTPISNAKLNIITYNDHDGMLMQTERFPGNANKRYKLSRAVLNDNYVWVSVNGVPLTGKLDYEILDDQVTVQISDAFVHESTDDIVITSISSANLATKVLGYRIFNDIFNRTHFKRLSKANTTYLTKPLMFSDTEIYVADSNKLTPPSLSKKVPGVVVIDGERIEFWKVDGNVLKELRRSTFGTAPSFYSEINTKVIDQSYEQTVPFQEQILKQVHYTNTSTNTYTISTVSNELIGDGIVLSLAEEIPFTTSQIDSSLASSYAATALKITKGELPVNLKFDLNGNGVVDTEDVQGYVKLSNRLNLDFTPSPTSNFNDLIIRGTIVSDSIRAADQLSVYYGGRLLNKTGYFNQDSTILFDHTKFQVLGNISSLEELPITKNLGDAYILTTTNHVWVYTSSIETKSINGFVYNGINYIEPEFTINTSTQSLQLNIKSGVQNNIRLLIVKKQFLRNEIWNDRITDKTTNSILESTSTQAKFLQLKEAELPDNYYYGGDPTLINENGFALTDDSASPLEGF